MIQIQLTRKQAEKLLDVLYDYTDEGPASSGWGSEELCALRNIVDQALTEGHNEQ